MRTPPIRPLILLGLVLAFLPAAAQHQQTRRGPRPTPGSVYTTNVLAQPVDTFSMGERAFLAGGYAPGSPCIGPSLPDGAYYFQVTDPAGTVLLSTDSVTARRIEVVGGVIARGSPGSHRLAGGPCGSRIVQLQPFLASPSPDHEYRLWVAPVAQYQPGTGVFGFPPSASKSDTFQIGAGSPPMTQTKISGTVFYDFDQNGVYDPQIPEEVPLAGWKLQVDTGGVITTIFTDVDGHYEFLRDMNASLHTLASIAPPPGFIPNVGGQWLATTPISVPVVTDVDYVGIDFGNLFFEQNTTTGIPPEFFETDEGCEFLEACDPEWRLAINELCLRTHLVSPPRTVEETLFTVPLTGTSDEACALFQDFLNPPDGDDDDDGDDGDDDDDGSGLFDREDDDECDDDPPADQVVAFELSRQFSTAVINVSCGPLAGLPTYIDQETNGVLVSLEHMIEHTQGMLCDPRSANTGPCGDPEWIAHFLMCLDEWHSMNSTGQYTFTRGRVPPDYFY